MGNVSVTCTRPALAAGATAPTITVVVTAPAQAATLSNTASVASTTADPNPANNTSRGRRTTVTASADLSIVKSGPATVVAGGARVVLAGGREQRSVRRGEPVGHRHAAGRGHVRVGDRDRLDVHATSGNVSVTCTRPALAAGATAPTITIVVTAPGAGGVA